MRKLSLSITIVLISLLITSCFPSYGEEADEHFWQGIEYVKQEEHELAITEFTMAIEHNPKNPYAYYNRGLSNFKIGNLQSSLSDYNIAIDLDPDNPYWLYERGFLNLQLGKHEQAILDLEKSLEIGLPSDYRDDAEEVLADLGQK